MGEEGIFINLVEKHEELSDKKTKKAEQKSILKNDYLPPPGHMSFLKIGDNTTEDVDDEEEEEEDSDVVDQVEEFVNENVDYAQDNTDGDNSQNEEHSAREISKLSHLIFHNGVVWNHGRTWDFAEDWFCLDIEWGPSSLVTGSLKHVQAFHVTSKSQGSSMEECSTSLGYVLAASVDMSDEDEDFIIVIFGGQSTETATTSYRLEIVTGPSDFYGSLTCKAYKSKPRSYKEFKLPDDYSHYIICIIHYAIYTKGIHGCSYLYYALIININ